MLPKAELAHLRAAVLVRERNGAKSDAMTVSPSLSSRSAVALPIALAAPVTSAIRRAAIIALSYPKINPGLDTTLAEELLLR